MESRKENELGINGLCNPYQFPCLWNATLSYIFSTLPWSPFIQQLFYYPATCLRGEGSWEYRCCTCQRGYEQISSLYTKETFIFSTFHPILSDTMEDPIHLGMNLDVNATLQTNQSIITAYIEAPSVPVSAGKTNAIFKLKKTPHHTTKQPPPKKQTKNPHKTNHDKKTLLS